MSAYCEAPCSMKKGVDARAMPAMAAEVTPRSVANDETSRPSVANETEADDRRDDRIILADVAPDVRDRGWDKKWIVRMRPGIKALKPSRQWMPPRNKKRACRFQMEKASQP